MSKDNRFDDEPIDLRDKPEGDFSKPPMNSNETRRPPNPYHAVPPVARKKNNKVIILALVFIGLFLFVGVAGVIVFISVADADHGYSYSYSFSDDSPRYYATSERTQVYEEPIQYNVAENGYSEENLVFSEYYDADAIKSFTLELVSSDIRIQQWNNDQFYVEWYTEKKDDSRVMIVKMQDKQLYAKEEYKNKILNFSNPDSCLTIYVPATSLDQLTLSTVSGDISLWFDEETTVTDSVNINSTSGEVYANNIGASDTFSVNTVSGSADIRTLTAPALKLGSTSGGFTLYDTHTKSIGAKTISGDYYIENSEFVDMSLETVSGYFQINSDLLFDLEYNTISGDINYDDTVYGRKSSGVVSFNSISGDLNVYN